MNCNHEKPEGVIDGGILITSFEELDLWYKDCLHKLRQFDCELQRYLYPALMARFQDYHDILVEIKGGYDGDAAKPQCLVEINTSNLNE